MVLQRNTGSAIDNCAIYILHFTGEPMDEPGEIREVLVSADAHVLADGYFTGSKNICPSSPCGWRWKKRSVLALTALFFTLWYWYKSHFYIIKNKQLFCLSVCPSVNILHFPLFNEKHYSYRKNNEWNRFECKEWNVKKYLKNKLLLEKWRK